MSLEDIWDPIFLLDSIKLVSSLYTWSPQNKHPTLDILVFTTLFTVFNWNSNWSYCKKQLLRWCNYFVRAINCCKNTHKLWQINFSSNIWGTSDNIVEGFLKFLVNMRPLSKFYFEWLELMLEKWLK
jgi:hypothetical protein